LDIRRLGLLSAAEISSSFLFAELMQPAFVWKYAPNGGAAEVLCLLRRVESERFVRDGQDRLGESQESLASRGSFLQKRAESSLSARTVAAEKSCPSRSPTRAALPFILEG
jgi:hypothetical protein